MYAGKVIYKSGSLRIPGDGEQAVGIYASEAMEVESIEVEASGAQELESRLC